MDEYIEIYKEDIPYSFEIVLGGDLFELGIGYNVNGDFFTVDLYKDSNALCIGEKILLDQAIFKNVSVDKAGNVDFNFPTDVIMAVGNSENIGRVGWEELENSVFLYVVPRSDLVV